MNSAIGSLWKPVLIGLGCLIILCCCLATIGGAAAFVFSEDVNAMLPEELLITIDGLKSTDEPDDSETPQEESKEVEPTIEIVETREPTLKEPTEKPDEQAATYEAPIAAAPELTGNQRIDDYAIFDDFSSNALGWPIYDDGVTIMKIEKQAYSIQIAEPDTIDWAYFPVDFIPYEISFEVRGPTGEQDGTFGVYCNYLDYEHFYLVEFNLVDNSYTIAEYWDDEFIPLTKKNDSGQYWHPAKSLKSPPTSTNKIAISCYQDSITLFANDVLVDQVNVTTPAEQPGEGAFFVYAYNFADENGYKVVIDNVEIYEPRQ